MARRQRDALRHLLQDPTAWRAALPGDFPRALWAIMLPFTPGAMGDCGLNFLGGRWMVDLDGYLAEWQLENFYAAGIVMIGMTWMDVRVQIPGTSPEPVIVYPEQPGHATDIAFLDDVKRYWDVYHEVWQLRMHARTPLQQTEHVAGQSVFGGPAAPAAPQGAAQETGISPEELAASRNKLSYQGELITHLETEHKTSSTRGRGDRVEERQSLEAEVSLLREQMREAQAESEATFESLLSQNGLRVKSIAQVRRLQNFYDSFAPSRGRLGRHPTKRCSISLSENKKETYHWVRQRASRA